MNNVIRIATGIEGFDELIEGGFPKGRTMILTGPAGSGKTTLSMQFLYNGVVRFGENGIFVTLEEEIVDLTSDMGRYGWDLEKLRKEKKFAIVQSPIPFEVGGENVSIDSLLDIIHKSAVEINAKRIVFDSIAALGLPYQEPTALRRDVLRLGAMLRDLGCTTILLTETPEGGAQITKYGIEHFVGHGVIVLHSTPNYRAIQVSKMRGTKHDTGIHLMRMTDKGIVVIPGETPF
jgi:KaiC/GvpD/RAD55 family RecA-like ATPase